MSEPQRAFGTVRGIEIDAVILLIGINVAVWIVWLFAVGNEPLYEFMSTHFMVSAPGVFLHHNFHTLLTASISHQAIDHILFNLIFFWYLGRDVEVFYGRNNMIVLYVFAGLVSSMTQIALGYVRHDATPCLGASGSIMGIAAAAAFIDPNKQLYIWGILPVRLWMLVPGYALLDFTGVVSDQGDHVAHAAHLGGAFAGLLFYVLDLRIFASRGRKHSGLVQRFGNWWGSRKLRVVQPTGDASRDAHLDRPASEHDWIAAREGRRLESLATEAKVPLPVVQQRIDAETAQRVDTLLSKISREGIGALTDEERAFLKHSSEKYKRS